MTGRLPGLALIVAAGLGLAVRPAGAFTIASGFSQSCHERLGLAAMAEILDGLPIEDAVVIPDDPLWRDVAAALAPAILDSGEIAAGATLTDAQQFVLYSLVVGIRAPDTGGHSVSNLDALRRAQVDPSPDSQHLHCLRAPREDGLAGDVQTLQGAETLIRAAVSEAVAAASERRGNTQAPLYLDFYGQLDVDVDTPAYLIGRAMHTLQDCYAHTLRSPDALTVYSVLNYVEAVEGNLDEGRDGMAHSDTLDGCGRAELAPIVARAEAVSVALADAAVALAQGDAGRLDAGFAPCAAEATDTAACSWVRYQAGCAPEAAPPEVKACCTQENGYCGSPYLAVAREKLSRPYVAEILSCAASPYPHRPSWGTLGLLVAAALWLRARALRRRSGGAGVPALVIFLAPASAMADGASARAPFAVVEGHLSLLSDAPERSFLNVTTGYGVRGGIRFGRWGLLAQVERNYWLPTELSNDLVAGALNIGVGAEWLALDGRFHMSASAGPSILWYDTALDDKGTVGVFADLRPAGLRWRLGRHVALAFDPLTLAIVAPVLHTPRIVQLEYRTLVGLEVVH